MKASDIKNIRCTKSESYPVDRMAEHELLCEIDGKTVQLHYTVTQHDDGEGFTIHSYDTEDIWKTMPESELRKLIPLLENAVEYHFWVQRIQKSDSIDDARNVFYGIMDSEDSTLTREQVTSLYDLIDRECLSLKYLSDFFEDKKDCYAILQLRRGEDTALERFSSSKEMERMGRKPDIKHYECVYHGELQDHIDQEHIPMQLEEIYETFNRDHPDGFIGHSLSVSDIVWIKLNGKISSHYVDCIGFTELPDFIQK